MSLLSRRGIDLTRQTPQVEETGARSGPRPVPSVSSRKEVAATEWRKLVMSVEPLIDRGELHSLMIASTHPEEGATTVAVELARLLTGHSERRLLLVDANWNHPQLHAQFYCPQDPGLIQVLRGEAELREVVHETPTEHLWVLPSGRSLDRSTNLLASHQVQRFLQAAQAEFDLTIVDPPPLGLTGEGLVFSSFVDGIILIVLAAVTPGPDLRDVAESLRRAQGRLLGVVVNNLRGEFRA